MTGITDDLLAELNRRGIKLRLVGGRMDVLAPAGALTPELRERLRRDRDRLLTLLHSAGSADTSDQPVITPRPDERHQPFPLTDIQHAYWVGRNPAAELGGVSTHFYFELERDGLDPQRLTRSLRRVIERHDMLRAIVQPDGRQRILADVPPYEIPVTDLRSVTVLERDAELARIRASMGHRAPAPDRWPLFDIRASQLDGTRIRLHVSVNILIVDAHSLALLFEDWRQYYLDAHVELPSLPLSFRDCVLAGEAARNTDRYLRAERYWLDRLDDLPPAPALPLAKQPAQLARTEFVGRAARLSRPDWAAIKRRARTRGLTPSAVLMTAYAEVLRQWSGQPSCTLNVTLFQRPPVHPRIGEIVGDFTSLTMLAVDGSEAVAGAGFTARAERVQRQLMRDLEHSSYSGVQVLRERVRRTGGGPDAAMPVVFTSAVAAEQDRPDRGRRFFGELVYSISQTPQVWLDHQASEEDGELLLSWDAVEELFPPGLLDDMFAGYRGLLAGLARDEQAWDDGAAVGLPAWQSAERDRANDTAVDLPAGTLCELVEARAERHPDDVAVIAEDGWLTYGEVVLAAHGLARRLGALGAAPGTLVGVLMDKGWQQVPALLGTARSGAAYLPLDPQWPEARRAEVLARAGVEIVVTSARHRAELTWPPETLLITVDGPEAAAAVSLPLPAGPAPDDLAYVIFTSGSTGRPKGVMIDHRGAVNTIHDINQRFGVGAGDRILALSALTFDLSVYDVFGMLAAGGVVVVPASSGTRDPAYWADLVDRHGVTVWNSVPALMKAYVDVCGPAADRRASKLRLVLLSGDWIPVSLPDAVRAVHPQAELISLGGATEASIWSVCYPIGDVAPQRTRIPYGKPLANQTLHVYDPQLRPCPVWTAGELYIGGTGVALGYWADPERTAERFIIHPATGQRLYRTGDLGRYLPGGDIEFLGRTDTQVKLNGYRIELGEIAAALRRCPGVGEALVDVATNPGTGRRQLVGYVIADHAADQGSADAAVDRVWPVSVAAGERELGAAITELAADLSTFDSWWRVVEAQCVPIMARTLARLGLFQIHLEVATADDAIRLGRIRPQYRHLVEQWLSTLAVERWLQPTGWPGQYRCLDRFDASRLDNLIRDALDALDVEGVHRAFLDYLLTCADQQVELLRGEVSPLELLLPDGSWRVTDALYAGNPVSYLLNRVAAEVVTSFVGEKDHPVTILEIGAGTGATTAQILPRLPAGRVRYRFTDVSTFFTERAKARFADHPAVEFGQLDVDGAPGPQGITPGSVHVVVAANVLHDAKDLSATLEHLVSLLTPGGILVAVEGTANTRIQMISVSFIEGFGHHEGQRELPLQSVDQWRQELTAAGFTRFAALPAGDAVAAAMPQHVLVAAVPGGRAVVDPATLRATLGETLPEYMVPQHYVPIDRLPLSPNGKVDRNALPPPWPATAEHEPVAPRDPLERRLWEVWHDTLGREDFGVADNFFELGGDSLHAVRIFALIRDEFDLRQTADEGLQALFDSPTIAALAAALRKGQPDL
jgi:pyochelin synthetase